MASPADQSIGANLPPLDPAERIIERLELEQIELLDRAMALMAEELRLPEYPQTDEEAAKISDHVVARRNLATEVGKLRLATTLPYRDAAAAVNDWFNQIGEPAENAVKYLTRRVGTYNDAKAARIRAEQAQRQREEEARARAAREEADKKAREAAEAQRLADEAKAKLQAATDDAARKAAETEMRGHLEQAEAAGADAEVLENRAAMSEDTAGALGRAADRPVAGALGASSASHGTTKWTFTIEAKVLLLQSLGPLGFHFKTEAIEAAIRAAIKDGVRDGIAGVKIHPENKTVIRQAKGAKQP